ncbi:MAG: DNA polymerase IV, partial [Acidobacteriota bacterium]|nr:DNA polymerase IV [Acidobacteriota bacterium]
AKVASDAEKPAGFVVLTREQACERFAAAPCRLIPGIGGKTAERLAALGVRTIAELATVPVELLRASFSARTALHLQALARFEHGGEVTQERKVVSESRERTFDHDLATLAELEPVLARLVDELSAALVRQQRHGRTVGIKVRLDDFSTHTRARTLALPVNAADDIGRVALELLRAFDPPRPVRLLGVRVAGLGGEHAGPEQLALVV